MIDLGILNYIKSLNLSELFKLSDTINYEIQKRKIEEIQKLKNNGIRKRIIN